MQYLSIPFVVVSSIRIVVVSFLLASPVSTVPTPVHGFPIFIVVAVVSLLVDFSFHIVVYVLFVDYVRFSVVVAVFVSFDSSVYVYVGDLFGLS